MDIKSMLNHQIAIDRKLAADKRAAMLKAAQNGVLPAVKKPGRGRPKGSGKATGTGS
jgi:hypothetical protein